MHLSVNKYPTKEILTQKEIKELYYATDQAILGTRDKAMLSIYYGCGLRRNEAVNLRGLLIITSFQETNIVNEI